MIKTPWIGPCKSRESKMNAVSPPWGGGPPGPLLDAVIQGGPARVMGGADPAAAEAAGAWRWARRLLRRQQLRRSPTTCVTQVLLILVLNPSWPLPAVVMLPALQAWRSLQSVFGSSYPRGRAAHSAPCFWLHLLQPCCSCALAAGGCTSPAAPWCSCQADVRWQPPRRCRRR
jgi:hypothetical protein